MFSETDKELIEKGAKALMEAAGKAAEIGVRGVTAEAVASIIPPAIGLAIFVPMGFKAWKMPAVDQFGEEHFTAIFMRVVSTVGCFASLVVFLDHLQPAIVALWAPEWVLMKTVLKAIKP